MVGFDMHMHSTVSDGAFAPAALVGMIKEQGLTGMALTDHDTAAGFAEAADKGKELGITVIPGIELSAEYNEKDVHILGYWVDDQIIEHDQQMIDLRKARFTRFYDMVARLERIGIELDGDGIIAQAENCGAPGRPLIAAAMVKAGYAAGIGEAFAKWLVRGAPGYVPKKVLDPLDAVAMIRRAGGIAVLAHPGDGVPDQLIPRLVEGGLGGIEVFHPDHDASAVQKYRRLAASFNLPVTGGSDFHNIGVRRIGGWLTPLSQLELLAAKREDLQGISDSGRL